MPDPSRNTEAGRVFNDLRNLGRKIGRNTDELLLNYGLERLLYRMSMDEPQRFVLKGGLLLAVSMSAAPRTGSGLPSSARTRTTQAFG
jgi:hypothetical protein